MKTIATFRAAVLLSTAFLAGCGYINKQGMVGSIKTLSIDAKQRLVTVNENGGKNQNRRVVCSEPSPDALAASAASLAGQGSLPKGASAKLAASISNSAASIGLRSQPIQIMRDGYFRLCEAYMNGAIDETEYKRVVNGVGSVLAVVTAIDALGARPVAPAVAINPGDTSANVDNDGADANSSASKISVYDFNAENKAMTPDQAKAIASVVKEYISYQKFLVNKFAKADAHRN